MYCTRQALSGNKLKIAHTVRRNRFGFHLMEILIAIVIMGILAAMSLPPCWHYLLNARRFEAEHVLSKLAIALEQYHLEHNSYENATLSALGFTEIIADRYYQLKISAASSDDYLIAIVPFSKWAKQDERCASLTLNSHGEKGTTGTGNINECW